MGQKTLSTAWKSLLVLVFVASWRSEITDCSTVGGGGGAHEDDPEEHHVQPQDSHANTAGGATSTTDGNLLQKLFQSWSMNTVIQGMLPSSGIKQDPSVTDLERTKKRHIKVNHKNAQRQEGVGQALHLHLPHLQQQQQQQQHTQAQSASNRPGSSGRSATGQQIDNTNPVARMVSNRHAFLANQQHRIAHACQDDKNDNHCSKTFGDYYDSHRNKGNTQDFIRSFTGMILNVFQQLHPDYSESQHALIQKEHSDAEVARAPSDDEHLPEHQARSVKDLDYESFVFEQAYQLVEPLQLELGIAPKHYLDYAYTPAYQQLEQHFSQEQQPYSQEVPYQANWFSHQAYHSKGKDSKQNIDDRLPADTSTALATDGKTCVALEDTEYDACKAIMTEQQHEYYYEENSNSWWKWWFSFSNSWWRSDYQGQSKQSDYTTSRTAFAGGSHGQVWRGQRVCSHSSRPGAADDGECDDDKPLILKRLKVEQGYRLLEAGLREVYFGHWIQGLVGESQQGLFTTYVDHFFRELPRSFRAGGVGRSSKQNNNDLELWIVFEDAGPSLRNYMYAPVSSASGFVMFQHSPMWAQLRMTNRDRRFERDEDNESMQVSQSFSEDGESPFDNQNRTTQQKKPPKTENAPPMGRHILRSVLHQILSAAAILHESGIVHRDIKPSNVMCTSDVPLDDLYALEHPPNIHCRLGDFSSGWDKYTNDNLYTKGPSPAEQTDEYAPPEATIGQNWVAFDERRPQSYDSWSIGVLALELLLGTPNVFSVDQRTTVLLTAKMKKEGASDEELQRALYLAALSHFCIYVPTSSKEQMSWPLRHGDPLYQTAMVKESCTLQDFHRALRARDPLGIGFDSSADLLLHLLWQLLAWDPMERMTAAEALQHPFFLSPDGTREALDLNIPGRHNALESQMFDPRLDFQMDDNVHEFICPKCGRVFADWRSCNRHANTRRHAKFCTYDRRHLPTCINTHSMLPAHPTSGYCDLQGRRPTIEDFHSIHLHPNVQFYGMFDGHTGNVASKYVASTLFDRLMNHLPNLQQIFKTKEEEEEDDWKLEVEYNVSQAFGETHTRFLEALALAPNMDQSGTTATAMLVTEEAIVLSSLGDSRAVLSSTKEDGSLSAIQLTMDHVASDPLERALVIGRGGYVSSSGGIDRVNGTLAITRSIGDAMFAPLLSRTPNVISMKRDEVRSLCGTKDEVPCFVVLASDGLWDVMSNDEAIIMVAEVVAAYDSTDRVSWNNGGAFQEAAEVLAVEAYVRGSTDNIGVCVVDIVGDDHGGEY